MAPEFTGAKEPDELPEVDTASDAYPCSRRKKEERKKERKKERKHVSTRTFALSSLFPVTKCRRGKAHARERRELNIGDPIGYPRKTRSFTSDLSARDYSSRTSRPRIPLLVFSSSVFIGPARRRVRGKAVFQTQRRNARRRGRMRTRGAQRAVRKQRRQMFSRHRFLDFFLAIAGDALRRRLYFAPWRKVKIDGFLFVLMSPFFSSFFSLQCSTKFFKTEKHNDDDDDDDDDDDNNVHDLCSISITYSSI